MEHNNVEMLNFISPNGPDHLLSMDLVDDMLNFGKNGTVLGNLSWFVSKVVGRHLKSTKGNTNSFV